MKALFCVATLITVLAGCTTPDQWRPEDHRRMMMQCRVSCGKGNMGSYDSWTAECECLKK